jgi:hypothetical protein
LIPGAEFDESPVRQVEKGGIKMKIISFRFMLLLLIGLVLADGIITEFVVGAGLATEGNPLMKVCLNEGNLMPLKLCGALMGSVILWNMSRKYQRSASTVALVFIAVYTSIVYWNVAIVFMSI